MLPIALYADLAVTSRGIHAIDFVLIAILNCFPLEFECCCYQTHVWRPLFGTEFHGTRNLKPLKLAWT